MRCMYTNLRPAAIACTETSHRHDVGKAAANYIGEQFNGRISVSKTPDVGSIPSSPAKGT